MKNPFSVDIDYSSRVYGLDVFRALAIIFVVMGHGGFIIGEALPGFPYIPLIDGVELFFVLSGFLIGNILIRIYVKEGTITLASLVRFWKRRWFRTIPNYYLILVLNIVLVTTGIINGRKENITWDFFFFLQNFASPFTDFFWESWSLPVEEWFYILVPLTFFAMHRLGSTKMPQKYVVLVPVLLFMIAPLVYRIAISDAEVDRFWYDVKFRKLVVTRLDAIMYGVFFSWLQFYHRRIFEKMALPAFIAGIILMYVFMHLQSLNSTGWFSKTFYFSFIGLSASLLLPYASMKKSCNTRFGRALTHISVISYSMYLLNLAPVAQVIDVHFRPYTPASGFFMYLVYWFVVIAASTLLYKYFEKPVMDLRDKK